MVGRTVSHYRIVSKLGEGGMGVVYKAEDTQLGRFVALKSLPPSALSNESRRARFYREARAASALNHPNIITVHDLIREGDSEFLVMEYVDGATLEHMIHGRRLTLNESLRIAIPIADACAAAHQAGIIHRDLKPGNVMVSKNGMVKVLDFGLAKLREDDRFAPEAETQTLNRTEDGAVLGTVSYMSPEQAQGKDIDPRSDIFSFGALLYEMIAGRMAFRGDNRISTLAAVISTDPKPVSEFVRNLPHDVDRLIQRCLRKDPAKRWQTMADLKVALEELKEESDSGQLAPGLAGGRAAFRPKLWWGAAALALPAIFAAVWMARAPTRPAEGLRKVALTTYPGSESFPSLSPDGKQVAFVWSGEKGDNRDVYVRLIEAGEPLRLTRNPEPESSPRWSPDGSRIAFLRQDSIYVVPALGGAERKLVDASVEGGYDWHPDGRSVVVADRTGLHVVALATGQRVRLTAALPGGNDWAPAFSPQGDRVAFVRTRSLQGQMDIMVVSVSGGEPRPVVVRDGFNHDPAWTADGKGLVFNPQWSALFRVPATGGAPVRVPESDDSIANASVSRAGGRLVYSKLTFDTNLWAAGLMPPSRPERVVASTRRDLSVQVSPDGRRLAFTSDRTGAWEIWTSDSQGGNQVQLTSFGEAVADGAAWSPDGTEIAFAALVKGNRDIYAIGAEGGAPRRLTSEPSDEGRPSYSRDGKTIYFRSDRSGKAEIWKMARSGGSPRQLTGEGGFDARESADGRTVYFTKGRTQPGLWCVPVAGGEAKAVRGLERVSGGTWAAGAAGIHWMDRLTDTSYALMLWHPAKESSEPVLRVEAPIWPVAPVLSVTADGRRAYWHQNDDSGADLVLLENFR